MQERLQKVLARAGIASRRSAEQLISEGRVKVNDRKVTEMGMKVDASRDSIRVDGALVADITDRVYYVLYKPAGCVTTMSDPQGRPTVKDWLRGVKERVYPVGRLDYDAEGALIVTNDGELAHKLMHPSFGAHRTYLAKVKGMVPHSALAELREGVRLEDGIAKPVEVEFVERTEKNTWIRLVVDEGRQHLVKRLCEAVGHPVQRLFRASYGGITVEGMMPGDLRALSSHEVKRLRAGDLPNASSALPPRRDARSANTKARRTMPGSKPAAAPKKPARTEREFQQPRPERDLQPSPASFRLNEEDFVEDDVRPERIERPERVAPAPGARKVFAKKVFEGEERSFEKKPFRTSAPAAKPFSGGPSERRAAGKPASKRPAGKPAAPKREGRGGATAPRAGGRPSGGTGRGTTAPRGERGGARPGGGTGRGRR